MPASHWSFQNDGGRFFEYRGARINFLDLGSGPPVLLLHGGGSWNYSFRNNIEALRADHRVLAIDIPGHGYSEIPGDWGYSLQDISDLLEAYLDNRGVSRAHIVGNSWGGGWAIHFALNHPKRVRRLALISPAGHRLTNEYDSSAWPYLVYPVLDEIILSAVDREAVASGYRGDLFYDGSKVSETNIDEIAGPFLYRPNLLAQAEYEKNLDWSLTGSRLNELKEVLLIWGKEDRYLPVQLAEKYAKLIPGARLVLIEKAGHLSHEEQPEEINRLLLEFFAN